jgi:hypothetical protein
MFCIENMRTKFSLIEIKYIIIVAIIKCKVILDAIICRKKIANGCGT